MIFRGASISGPPSIWTVTESIITGSPKTCWLVTCPVTGNGWFRLTTSLLCGPKTVSLGGVVVGFSLVIHDFCSLFSTGFSASLHVLQLVFGPRLSGILQNFYPPGGGTRCSLLHPACVAVGTSGLSRFE